MWVPPAQTMHKCVYIHCTHRASAKHHLKHILAYRESIPTRSRRLMFQADAWNFRYYQMQVFVPKSRDLGEFKKIFFYGIKQESE